jgi:tetratricopeptide (TPR) repeat protein
VAALLALLPGFAALAAPAAAAGQEVAPVSGAPPSTAGPAGGAGATPASSTFEELVRDADAAYRRDDYKEARRLYAAAVGIRPDALHPLRRLALLESWDGDLDDSIAHYEKALELAPRDFDLNLEHAKVLAWDGRYPESIACYEELRPGHPDDARVLLGLGQALGWAGRYADSDAVYRDMEARQIEPIQAHLGRARLLAWQGKLDEATDDYRDVLKAEPGNLDARIGLAQVNHWRGQDRQAQAQIDNIVVDHPESRDAKQVQQEIHDALRPTAGVEGFRFSDNESNRVDSATLSYAFQAEPQTSIRIVLSTYDASFRCDAATFCNAPGQAVGDELSDEARVLMAGLTSRVIAPITFHARLGATRETTLGDTDRTLLVGGGFIRWQVGPRFSVTGNASREALLDTAVLIDRGIRVDSADMRLEHRFQPEWLLFGAGGFGLYSDGNRRWTAAAGVQWSIRPARPRVTGTFSASYRSFDEDLDNGYFDPLRYDSELIVLSLGDEYRRGRWFWQAEGTFGRQAFSTGGGAAGDAGDNDRVQGIYLAAGTKFSPQVSLEAYYWRSDYALQLATGFTSTKSGFALRIRP